MSQGGVTRIRIFFLFFSTGSRFDSIDFFLDLLKAMYGLNDAPLCWQLFLADFYITTLHALQSSYDECFFIWHNPATQDVDAMASAHVDDNGIMSTEDFFARPLSDFFG